ncbi:MAG: xanthine dehydrogenase, partial [Spirochaetes bacterium]
IEKVLGKSRYADDIFPGEHFQVYTFRSPLPHIRINKLDISEALKFPDVVKIITAKDIPGKNVVAMVLNDYPALADKVAKFYGQPIALIVAKDLNTAKKSASLIKLDYTPLPYVLDAKEALKKDAPRIYGKNNIFKSFKVVKGDIKKAFKECDIIVEKEYRTNYQVHSYLETQGMVAEPRPDGSIVIYGTMQCPFYVLDAVHIATGIPKSKIRIIQTTTGGAFGGKEDVPSILAVHAAISAILTGKPVKLIYNREEDFISMSKRHPSYVRIKYGAKKNGRIIAAEAEYILDGGAFATLSPIVLWRGTVHVCGPYDIPNVFVKSYAVATNKVPCGAFRGFGQPQVSFANESLIDELAYKLGISPVQIRKINGLKKGKTTITGYKVKEEGIFPVFEKVLKESKFEKKWQPPEKKKGNIRKGIGISVTYYGVGLGAGGKHLSKAGAFLQIESDGSVRLAFGNTDMGQGAKTILSQIAAEALNAPYEVITPFETDTTRVPDSGPTVASRTTYMSGNAIKEAARPILKNLIKASAMLLNCSEKDIIPEKTRFYNKKTGKSVSYFDAVKKAWEERLHLSSEGWYIPPDTTFDKNGQGNAYYSYTFSANIAEVEVNMKTGEVKVLRIWAAHDIGKAINPQLAIGQIEGGVLQGVGYAIMENLVYNEKGIMVNPNFTGYIIPTIKDAPDIKAYIVENPDKNGPYGARGLGEPPLIGVAPAIANAIFNATGIRINSLPILPEKIMEQIIKEKANVN